MHSEQAVDFSKQLRYYTITENECMSSDIERGSLVSETHVLESNVSRLKKPIPFRNLEVVMLTMSVGRLVSRSACRPQRYCYLIPT